MAQTPSHFSLDRVIALGALALACGALLRPAPEPPPSLDLQPLRAELAALRQAVHEVAAPLPPAVDVPTETEVVPAAPDGVTLPQLHEWIWGLDQRLTKFEQTHPAPNPLGPFTDIAHARQVALNFHASPEERLQALRVLRAANVRTPELIDAMLHLHASRPKERIRAELMKQLTGLDDPRLKSPLLVVLREDDSPRVRERAVEALSPFASDPTVRLALTTAFQTDPDQKVQRKAQQTIDGKLLGEGKGKHR